MYCTSCLFEQGFELKFEVYYETLYDFDDDDLFDVSVFACPLDSRKNNTTFDAVFTCHLPVQCQCMNCHSPRLFRCVCLARCVLCGGEAQRMKLGRVYATVRRLNQQADAAVLRDDSTVLHTRSRHNHTHRLLILLSVGAKNKQKFVRLRMALRECDRVAERVTPPKEVYNIHQ